MKNRKGWGKEDKEGIEKLMLNFEERLPFIPHTQGH